MSQATISAQVDYIQDWMKKQKLLDDTIFKLYAEPSLKILINPLPDNTLTNYAASNAEEFLACCKQAIMNLLTEYGQTDWHVKMRNIIKSRLDVHLTTNNKLALHELSAEHEGMAFTSEVQIVSMSKQESYVKEGVSYCSECKTEYRIYKKSNQGPECTKEDCKRYDKPTIIKEESIKMGDIQNIIIQEPLDLAKHGSPKHFNAVIKDKLVQETFMGQRKEIVGVVRSLPQKESGRHTLIINILSARNIDDTEPMQPTKEQLAKFETLAKKENYLDIISDSIAPEIKFNSLPKLCIMLCLIGGRKVDGIRGKMHMLLVGDPSQAKTAIIKYFTNLPWQKAAYASGGTASGSGITVSLQTMPDRTKRPRAGIVALCTGGFVGLDELSLFEPEDLGRLYEAMEDGKMTYRKGGYDMILDADTAIIGAVNPKWHIYDFDRSIKENVNLPWPIISRFNLRINMVEEYDIKKEKQIEDYIALIDKIGVTEYVKRNNLLSSEEISLLINHCKTINPEFSPDADALIKGFYIEQKELEFEERLERKGAFRIDRRFARGIRAMAAAYTALHQRKTVTVQDVEAVVDIYKQTMRTFKMNPDKGVRQFDMEEAQHTPKTAFEQVCKELEEKNPDKHFSEAEVTDECLARFRNHFQNDYKVHAMWEEFYEKQRFTTKGGRYRLI